MNFRGSIRCGVILWSPCLLLPVQEAAAQTQNAHINGTIADPSGAVVAQAEITVTNVLTQVVRSTRSNAAGNYLVSNLNPGTYQVQVAAPGFQTAVSGHLELDVNQTATFNLQLQVGAVTESVEVVAEGAQIESSTAQLGTVVTQQNIEELPLNGRNFTQLLTLTPGATPVSVAQNSGGAQTQRIGTFSFPSSTANRTALIILPWMAYTTTGTSWAPTALPPMWMHCSNSKYIRTATARNLAALRVASSTSQRKAGRTPSRHGVRVPSQRRA